MAGQWKSGPWEVLDDPDGLRVTLDGDRDGLTVCEFPFDWEADHANARLISAAPDLAEALTGLIGLIELIIPTLEGTQRIGVEDNHRLKDARAALAKAGAL